MSRLTGLLTVDDREKMWGKTFASTVREVRPVYALPPRPDLPWDSCTVDGAAMDRFQAEYLAAFRAAEARKESPRD